MHDHPRSAPRARRTWALVLSAVLALTATRCAKPSESREVADRFMELYYVRMSVAEAVTLCSGAARARLEGELRAIQGVPPDAPSGEPRVSFSLSASTNSTPAQATYTYRVAAHTSDVGNVVAALTVANEGGRWLVTSFSESEGLPTSCGVPLVFVQVRPLIAPDTPSA